MKIHYYLCGALMAGACTTEPALSTAELLSRSSLKNNMAIPNPLGTSTTWSSAGSIDLTSDFFQDYGTNSRTCGHCHKASEGWTVSAASVRALFDRTDGLDPIFRTNDGTVSPDADVSTVDARRDAYAMLLNYGAIRVGVGVPATAEFELAAVDDPYGHASAAELSLFRRPLPSTNLAFIPGVMWDGRVAGDTVNLALLAQSNGATQGHAAAPDPISQELRESIVGFESALFTGQLVAKDAGRLDSNGAHGGAEALASQAFVADRFNLFDAWKNSDNDARRAVYRGQELFNTKTRGNTTGTCRTCHSVQNVGTNKNGAFFNIGISAATRRTTDRPLYTLRNKLTGQQLQTTDPGRALITGLWKDVGKFKVAQLRGLGARAPYFHDGSAETLEEVVEFYEANLTFSFTDKEKADLVAFLSAL